VNATDVPAAGCGGGNWTADLEAALRLVEASCPPNTAPAGTSPLSRKIDAFLEQQQRAHSAAAQGGDEGGDEAAVPVYVGYTGDVAECGGAAPLAALLRSDEPRAQMAALRDISYLTHCPPVTEQAARLNRAALASSHGLLQRIGEIAASGGEVGATCAADGDVGALSGVKRAHNSAGKRRGARDRSVEAEVKRLAALCLANFQALDG